jgi:predicted O-methyltransferase YrrM
VRPVDAVVLDPLCRVIVMARRRRIREVLRAKVVRCVQDAVRPYHDDQMDTLRRELAELRAELRRQGDRVVEFARQAEIRDRRDVRAAAEREAAADAAVFVAEHMTAARSFGHPQQTLEHGLSMAPSGGMALEFGVFTGTTLKIIAAARGEEKVYGFDSFDGLPEHWRPGFTAGAFGVDGLPEVSGAQLVVGLFSDTLPTFLAEHRGVVDFLHIDSDLYSSAATVLASVGPRLRAGSVIAFDEFFNYPGWREHEHRAWIEYAESSGTNWEYVGYTHDNEQVLVRIVQTPAGSAEE